MAGREKMRVYVYDTKGEFVKMFNSMAEFRETYYSTDVGKRPIFIDRELGNNYHYNNSFGIVAFQARVGKNVVKRTLAIDGSKYCAKQDIDSDKYAPVEILNNRGDVIAIVKTQHLVSVLIPTLSQPAVTRFLKDDDVGRHSFNKTGLSCRYQPLPVDATKEDIPVEIVVNDLIPVVEQHVSKTVAEILVIKEQELAELTTTINLLKKLNI